MLLGLPGSPGMVLIRIIRQFFFQTNSIGFGLLVGISIILFVVLVLRSSIQRKNDWISSDNITRMSYYAGLILYSLNGIAIGMGITTEYRLNDFINFTVIMISVAGIFFATFQVSIKQPIFSQVNTQLFHIPNNYVEKFQKFVLDVIRGSGKLFEDEAGMLWTFVVILLGILAFLNLSF
jgi:hypothetical protein